MKATTSLLILSFVFLLSFQTIKTNQNLRLFITGLLQTVSQNNEYQLDDDCFGDKFDEDLQNLISSVNTLNLPSTLNSLYILQKRVEDKCPLNEFNKLNVDTLTSLFNGQLFKNLINNGQNVLIVVRDLVVNGNHETVFELGKALGELTNYIIYNRKQLSNENENFLAFINIEDPLKAAEEFIDGLIQGVANDFKTNKCKVDIAPYKAMITVILYNLFQEFNRQAEWYDTFMQIYSAVIVIPNIKSCNFEKLGQEILNVNTYIGRAKIMGRLTLNILKFKSLYEKAFKSLEEENYFDIGLLLGEVMKIGLNYSTD